MAGMQTSRTEPTARMPPTPTRMDEGKRGARGRGLAVQPGGSTGRGQAVMTRFMGVIAAGIAVHLVW